METVRVRIAVAVTHEGEWNSCGWGRPGKDVSDADKMALAVETMPDGESRYWVEADIPLPSPPTIEGTVTQGDQQ